MCCSPYLPLATMQTEQYCNHGKSLAISVNLIDSEIKTCLPQAVSEGTNIPPLSHLAEGSLSYTFDK